MREDEYALMFRVEGRHWWYVSLRRLFHALRKRHAAVAQAAHLDVACGTGGLLESLPPAMQAFGIDFCHEAVAYCGERGIKRCAQGSALALPFGEASFDSVSMMDLLCHQSVADKRVPLREACRVLKPGGLLFVNVPAYQWLHSSHDVAVHNDRRFRRSEMIRLLEDCGFETIQSTYWNCFLFPVLAAVRLWRKRWPPAESDLGTEVSPWMNGALTLLLSVERGLVTLVPLRIGLSIFAVARKRHGEPGA